MSKLKTTSSVAKRFKVTKSNNLLRHQAGKNHLLQKKRTQRKKKLSRVCLVNKSDLKNIRSKLLK
uniref:50S ribosomal protein L35 n=1 Tax=Apophlaea sinclairii TaxID=212746 RepID=A0A1C9CBD6_9FLOR|nr:ribosomal protein L35 [Apophlaea sinclairii]AOM65710.1 ribosomal protein L35 [Apophlaea sinclairii]